MHIPRRLYKSGLARDDTFNKARQTNIVARHCALSLFLWFCLCLFLSVSFRARSVCDRREICMCLFARPSISDRCTQSSFKVRQSPIISNGANRTVRGAAVTRCRTGSYAAKNVAATCEKHALRRGTFARTALTKQTLRQIKMSRLRQKPQSQVPVRCKKLDSGRFPKCAFIHPSSSPVSLSWT